VAQGKTSTNCQEPVMAFAAYKALKTVPADAIEMGLGA
jgi:hypothetical protein